jgi:hypothetical protein
MTPLSLLRAVLIAVWYGNQNLSREPRFVGLILNRYPLICWRRTQLQSHNKKAMKAFCIATGLLTCLILAGWLISRSGTGGQYFYPIDDAYIGMALAKQVAQHGIWGPSQQFANVSSTPAFALLLAMCDWITGPQAWWPIALATMGSMSAILAAQRLLANTSLSFQIAGCLGVVVLGLLHVMALIGMEHSIQIALSLLFVSYMVPVLAKRESVRPTAFLIAAAMVSVRYEGLFVAAGACLLLLAQRCWRDTVLLAGAAWLPVVGFGIYCKFHGSTWLPNPLLLKGGVAWPKLLNTFFEGLYFWPLLLLLTWVSGRTFRQPSSPARVVSQITIIAAWLHVFLGAFGWVYRYEAYLLALSVVSVVLLLSESVFRRGFGLLVTSAAALLLVHAVEATGTLPGRSRAIYSQQYQTARLAMLLNAPVAVNDLGAPAFFTDLPIVDLTGLGTQAVMDARLARRYDTQLMREVLQAPHVQMIAIYDDWFSHSPKYPWGGPPLPSEYTRVAHLETYAPPEYVNESRVEYYAAPGFEGPLRQALGRLRDSLPASDRLTSE